MTRDAAVRRLAEFSEHNLNGASFDIRLPVYECLATVLPTPGERNEWRLATRAQCRQRGVPVPLWAREDEML